MAPMTIALHPTRTAPYALRRSRRRRESCEDRRHDEAAGVNRRQGDPERASAENESRDPDALRRDERAR